MVGTVESIAPPRPPLLERISYRQWVGVDVVLAGLFFATALAHLYSKLDIGASTAVSGWVLWLLYALATLPIAFRRRWPELSLVCVTGALAVATMLGHFLDPAPVLALPLFSVILKYNRRQSLVVLGFVEAAMISAWAVDAALRQVQTADATFNIIVAGATWFVGDSVRTRRAYQKGLVDQAQERQRQELDRARHAVVQERMEIARELHDVIAHSLSVIVIQSGVGRHVIDQQPDEARLALAAIEDTSRSALQELRQVLGVLRRGDREVPDLNPTPTLSDLDDLIGRVRSAGVPVDLQFSGGAPSLPRGLELSIYRIVQEALTNVVKHARSAHTWVRLQYGQDELIVKVTNTALGAGSKLADPTAASTRLDNDDRHGIIGMKERAAAFGGTLSAEPLPDGGFQVLAHLPLRAAP